MESVFQVAVLLDEELDVILVVSYPGEEHTAEVVRRLLAQGQEVVPIDLSDFPSRAGLALEWRPGTPPSYVVHGPNGPIDLARVRVVWWRRVRPHEVDAAIANPGFRAFATSETSQAVNGSLG